MDGNTRQTQAGQGFNGGCSLAHNPIHSTVYGGWGQVGQLGLDHQPEFLLQQAGMSASATVWLWLTLRMTWVRVSPSQMVQPVSVWMTRQPLLHKDGIGVGGIEVVGGGKVHPSWGQRSKPYWCPGSVAPGTQHPFAGLGLGGEKRSSSCGTSTSVSAGAWARGCRSCQSPGPPATLRHPTINSRAMWVQGRRTGVGTWAAPPTCGRADRAGHCEQAVDFVAVAAPDGGGRLRNDVPAPATPRPASNVEVLRDTAQLAGMGARKWRHRGADL